MTKNDGKAFELLTEEFFSYLFHRIGYTIIKSRPQQSGTQHGFDVQLIISKNYASRNIFIECKDYKTDIHYGGIVTKALDLKNNYNPKKNDLAFYVSPKSNFVNSKNSEKIEPSLNDLFDFEIRLLEKSNGIERLFAIRPDLYEKIYQRPCEIEIDEEKEINQFDEIIHSRGNLRKIVIDENDYPIYLLDIKKQPYYIPRVVLVPEDYNDEYNKQYLFYSSQEERLKYSLQNNIDTLLKEDEVNGIVLLGNPGSGKSCELKELAIYYWENRDIKNWVPYFRNVNTFSNTSTIEEYLPAEWQQIPQLLIILDGIDEISDITNFVNKLEKFIQDSSDKKIKYVLSSRTNIYESSIKNVASFKCFYLEKITIGEARTYLRNAYGFNDEELEKFTQNPNIHEFLQNPFYLNLLAKSYRKTGKIITNRALLIGEYIKERLNSDYSQKFKKRKLDIGQIKTICKKVALCMEAQQINKLSGPNLNVLLSEEKDVFKDCSFVNKVFNEEAWKFDHRNIQEYFVAQTLANLPFEKIIDFIRVDDLHQKVHPSWSHVISLLINIIDSKGDTFKNLLEWLKENDSEIIFKADSDRVSVEIPSEIFQSFFKKRCIDKNLWLKESYYNGFEIANFANTENNIDFLFNIIEDSNIRRRARVSALDLLSHIKSSYRKEDLKKLLLRLLSESVEEIDFNFKVDVTHAIESQGFHLKENYLSDMIKSLGTFDHHKVVSRILHFICLTNVEDHFNYIQSVVPKILGNVERNYRKDDNFMSNEKDNLKTIINKFKSEYHIIYGLRLLIQDYSFFSTTTKELKNLVDKLINCYHSNPESISFLLLIQYIIDSLKNRLFLFRFEEVLIEFFKSTKTSSKAFREIYKSKEIDFDNKRHFLTLLADADCLKLVKDDYKLNTLTDQDVKYFRNNLSHSNFELAEKFQNTFIEEFNFDFKDDLLNYEERKGWKQYHETKDTVNFTLLFNPENIKEKIRNYFQEENIEQFDWDRLIDREDSYYRNLKKQIEYPSIIFSIMRDALHRNRFTLEKVIDMVDSDLYLINQIKENLKPDVKPTKEQQNFIKNWCFSNIPKTVFSGLCNCKFNNQRRNLIWYFRNYFDFVYPEKVLLDLLLVDGYMKPSNSEHYGHQYIVDKVPRVKLVERIKQNMRLIDLSDHFFHVHALLALENNIEELKDQIINFIKQSGDSSYYRRTVLRAYYAKYYDITLLKELISGALDYFEWYVIDLLVEIGRFDIIKPVLLKNFNNTQDPKPQLQIINYLIRCNYEHSFKLFNEWILNNLKIYNISIDQEFSRHNWSLYNNQKAVLDLVGLLELEITSNYKFNRHYTPTAIATQVLINIAQDNSAETCEFIMEKTNELKEKHLNMSDHSLFFLNKIHEDIKDCYFKHKSKPLSFRDIAIKIEKHKYDFL